MLNYTENYVITYYEIVVLCKTLVLVIARICFFSVSKPVTLWLNAVAVLKGSKNLSKV